MWHTCLNSITSMLFSIWASSHVLVAPHLCRKEPDMLAASLSAGCQIHMQVADFDGASRLQHTCRLQSTYFAWFNMQLQAAKYHAAAGCTIYSDYSSIEEQPMSGISSCAPTCATYFACSMLCTAVHTCSAAHSTACMHHCAVLPAAMLLVVSAYVYAPVRHIPVQRYLKGLAYLLDADIRCCALGCSKHAASAQACWHHMA